MLNKIDLLNSYFDHIYVITLHRATERHLKIQQKLNGLNFTFFYGKDNKDFQVSELINNGIYNPEKAKYYHRYNKEMTPGQIGCSWSHKLVYEDIIKNNYQKVLILEDDVFINEAGCDQLNSIIAELPPHWDLIYFDYLKNEVSNWKTSLKQLLYHVQHSFGILKWNHTMIQNLFAKKYTTHLSRAGFHEFTSAYAITQNGAKKLIAMQTPIAFIADNLLAHAISNKTIEAFICLPKVFEQESQTLGNEVVSYV